MLDHQLVRVAPVVEELAALDVPADAPTALVAALGEVLPADGDRVEVGDLVGGVDVTGARAQVHREGVVVDRDAALVAADERHRGPPPALAVQVQEVADDQTKCLQVPVQGLGEFRRLQDHVAQSLDPGGSAGRALGGVGPSPAAAEVERERGLFGQGRELLGAVDDADREAGRVGQVHDLPAAELPEVADRTAGGPGQTVQVRALGGPERRPEEP